MDKTHPRSSKTRRPSVSECDEDHEVKWIRKMSWSVPEGLRRSWIIFVYYVSSKCSATELYSQPKMMFFILHVCVCAWVCACAFKCLERTEEGIRSHGTGIASVCELPDMTSGNHIPSLYKSGKWSLLGHLSSPSLILSVAKTSLSLWILHGSICSSEIFIVDVT